MSPTNSLSVARVDSVVCIVLFILVGFPCRCCSFCVGIVVVAGVSVVVEVCCLFCCSSDELVWVNVCGGGCTVWLCG